MPTGTTVPHRRRPAFTRIATGSDGSIWAIDGSSGAWRHTGNRGFVPASDHRYAEGRIMAIAAGSTSQGNQAWGINGNGRPVIFQPESEMRWVEKGVDADSSLGPYVDIAAAADGTVCGLRKSGGFRPTLGMRLVQDTWTPMTQPASILDAESFGRIAVGSATSIYALDLWGGAFRYQAASRSWTKLVDLLDDNKKPQPAISLAVGSDGVVWAVGADEMIYMLAPDGSEWRETGWGGVVQIAATGSYNLIGLTPNKTGGHGEVINDIWVGVGRPPNLPPRA